MQILLIKLCTCSVFSQEKGPTVCCSFRVGNLSLWLFATYGINNISRFLWDSRSTRKIGFLKYYVIHFIIFYHYIFSNILYILDFHSLHKFTSPIRLSKTAVTIIIYHVLHRPVHQVYQSVGLYCSTVPHYLFLFQPSPCRPFPVAATKDLTLWGYRKIYANF